MNRRHFLKSTALAAALPQILCSQIAYDRIESYLESCARDDGGYGWDGQDHSHLTPTFFVIGSYRALKKSPPRHKELVEFVRTHHPAALKKLEQERRIFEFQQIQALTWLGADISDLRPKIAAFAEPLAYLKQYERHGYPLFSSEIGVILARQLLGLSNLPQPFIDYLDSRRRPNGSFNNTPASDQSDGHILSTWWGLQALQTLNRQNERFSSTIDWIQSCQLPSGGFTFAPKPDFGGVDDIAYVWAAIRSLKLLRVQPARLSECVTWIHSLHNPDGGFGDRPGWSSNSMATFYALDSLQTLGALNNFPPPRPRTIPRLDLPSNLHVFTIQLEAHGQGSPAEAVDLARSLRIHLWGAKNAKPTWLARAQSLADQQKANLQFFASNEEYGTWVDIPGLGTYSHTSDIIAPSKSEIGSSLAGPNANTWAQFRERRLGPLERGNGRLIWQFGENEELVRMFLDDSLERGGYSAISTYHFGNPDFPNSEPFLHRWRGKIPFVALQDAHGPEPWWFADMTTGFRTLFLAAEPTWEAWLDALKQNRVVPVRRDQWTKDKLWMHAPNRELADFIRSRETEWRWWNNRDVERPLISLVALRPEDEFETARPQTGLTLRIRCAWQNTPQGLLKQPLAEFSKLLVDGKEVPAELFRKARPNGLLDDHYHFANFQNLFAGNHTATAIATVLETKKEIQRTLQFSV